MKKLLPVILALVGLCAGTGTGLALKKSNTEGKEVTCGPESSHDTSDDLAQLPNREEPEENEKFEYVKLNNQFIVPIVEDGKVGSLVVLALNLEVVPGYKEAVFALEPKLRNAFLLILFDHANAGGFKGTFTSSNNMTVLQNALREVARKTLGNSVSDVLITDVVRQDNIN